MVQNLLLGFYVNTEHWAKKLDCFNFKFVTSVHVDIYKRYIYQIVQFFICSKTDMLCVTAFKYFLRNFSVTTVC